MGYKLLSSQLDTVCTHFGKVEATWQREANQEGAAMGGDTIQPTGITDKKTATLWLEKRGTSNPSLSDLEALIGP